jgi:hypothetical protein
MKFPDTILGSTMKGAFHGSLIGVVIGGFWLSGFKTGFQMRDEEYKREKKSPKE